MGRNFFFRRNFNCTFGFNVIPSLSSFLPIRLTDGIQLEIFAEKKGKMVSFKICVCSIRSVSGLSSFHCSLVLKTLKKYQRILIPIFCCIHNLCTAFHSSLPPSFSLPSAVLYLSYFLLFLSHDQFDMTCNFNVVVILLFFFVRSKCKKFKQTRCKNLFCTDDFVFFFFIQ